MTIEKARQAEILLYQINLKKDEIRDINAASLESSVPGCEPTTHTRVMGRTIFFPQKMLIDYITKQLEPLEKELSDL